MGLKIIKRIMNEIGLNKLIESQLNNFNERCRSVKMVLVFWYDPKKQARQEDPPK